MLNVEEYKLVTEGTDLILGINNKLAVLKNQHDLIQELHKQLHYYFQFAHSAVVLNPRQADTYFLYCDALSEYSLHSPPGNLATNEFAISGDGIASRILTDAGPRLIELQSVIGTGSAPGWVIKSRAIGMEELIVVGLEKADYYSGSLILFMTGKSQYSKLQLDFLASIVRQFSLILSYVTSIEYLQEKDNAKSFLLSMAQEIAAIRTKSQLLMTVEDRLQRVFPIKGFIMYYSDANGLALRPFVWDEAFKQRKSNFENDAHGDESLMNNKIAQKVMVTQHPQVWSLQTLRSHFDFSVGLSPSMDHLNLEAVVSPLSSKGESCGLLVILSGTTAFRQQDKLKFIKLVSAQLGTAMVNILANEEINRKEAEINKYKDQLEEEKFYLQEEIELTHNYSEVIGNSQAMCKVFRMVTQVADTTSSVLILGETGTGKELIARAIHNNSMRKDKIMVKVNCAALPANLIESELFGHEKGSFTGAVERKIGKFELANHGTLFLDEIGELPIDLQVKILRALQEREIERVGGRSVIKIDVRIIAATNRDLLHEVKIGTFRSDLYFRLNVFPILLPPLRSRREDIPLLADYFLDKHAKQGLTGKMSFSGTVLKQLIAYEWPGNVRELEHLIERSVLLSNKTTIDSVHLAYDDKEYAGQINPDVQVKTIDEVEREHIISVLKKTNGKIAGIGGAAALLKIKSTTLNSKIRKLGIRKGLITKR